MKMRPVYVTCTPSYVSFGSNNQIYNFPINKDSIYNIKTHNFSRDMNKNLEWIIVKNLDSWKLCWFSFNQQ